MVLSESAPCTTSLKSSSRKIQTFPNENHVLFLVSLLPNPVKKTCESLKMIGQTMHFFYLEGLGMFQPRFPRPAPRFSASRFSFSSRSICRFRRSSASKPLRCMSCAGWVSVITIFRMVCLPFLLSHGSFMTYRWTP